MNVEKTKVMRISRQPSPVTIMLDQNNWRMWKVLNIWVAYYQMMEDIRVKLNPGLSRKKLHSTRRRLFLPANWT